MLEGMKGLMGGGGPVTSSTKVRPCRLTRKGRDLVAAKCNSELNKAERKRHGKRQEHRLIGFG